MIRRRALSLIALVAALGCAGIQGPGYIHPGSAEYQRTQAQRFDPYPMTDVGPETNARPLAFIRPAPENERAQNSESFATRFGQPPPPGLYRPTRTMTTRQTIPFAPPVVAEQPAPPFFVP